MKYVLVMLMFHSMKSPSPVVAEFDSLAACQSAYKLISHDIEVKNGWNDRSFWLGVCARKGD